MRNVTLASALVVVCVLVGLATGFWLLFRLAYVIAIGLPLLYLWNRSMIRNLAIEVLRRDERVTRGRSLRGRVVLRSHARLPKVWLEVEDHSTLPQHVTKRVVTLGLEEDDRIEVLTGLEPGERIVIAGQGGLEDGSSIKILPEDTEAQASNVDDETDLPTQG